jgi:hypothetical protein
VDIILNKTLPKVIAGLLIALLAPTTLAGGATSYGMLPEILVYNGHVGLLVRHSAMIDPDGCGRTDWFILPETHPHYKVSVGMIMAAHAAKQKVSIHVSGCVQGLPAIQHIGMQQS